MGKNRKAESCAMITELFGASLGFTNKHICWCIGMAMPWTMTLRLVGSRPVHAPHEGGQGGDPLLLQYDCESGKGLVDMWGEEFGIIYLRLESEKKGRKTVEAHHLRFGHGEDRPWMGQSPCQGSDRSTLRCDEALSLLRPGPGSL